MLNALAAYQGKPSVTYRELNALLEREDALLADGEIPPSRYEAQPQPVVGRGVRLRRFSNGNGHLFFEPDTLRDINRALAEYYGDVLPDAEGDGEGKPRASTAVAKDLQYYPTPAAIVDRVLADLERMYPGQIAGNRPYSFWKIFFAVVAVIIAVIVVAFLSNQ